MAALSSVDSIFCSVRNSAKIASGYCPVGSIVGTKLIVTVTPRELFRFSNQFSFLSGVSYGFVLAAAQQFLRNFPTRSNFHPVAKAI